MEIKKCAATWKIFVTGGLLRSSLESVIVFNLVLSVDYRDLNTIMPF